MSALLELFNSGYSSPKMLNKTRQEANNANISANGGSNTGFAGDEIEDLAEGESLPFEELLTQHTSSSAKKPEGKNAKNTVETLSKSITEKISEGEEPDGDTIFANMFNFNPDDLANTIINLLNGNTNTAESEKLYDFFNTLTSEKTLFSDTDTGEIIASLKALQSPPYSPQREGIKLFDTLTSFFQTTPPKNDGVSLHPNILANNDGNTKNPILSGDSGVAELLPQNKSFDTRSTIKNDGASLQSGVFAERHPPAFAGEGLSLHPNILADNTGNTKNPFSGDDARSAILESLIFNAGTKGISSSGNSIITNMPPATGEGVISKLNELLNNYEENITISEISLTDSKTREAHNALKSLLQTIVNEGRNNVFSFNAPMDAARTEKMPVPSLNNVSSFNTSMDDEMFMQEFAGLTMNRTSKISEIQKVFLQNTPGEINGFAQKITSDPNNFIVKNEIKNAGTKEQTASPLNTPSGSASFTGNEEGNSSGNLSQQGKDTPAFAPNNNQQEKTPVNNVPSNNPDFRQNISEPLTGSATTILSSAENQKHVASPLFQGNTPAGTNTLQNNVMEQLLENIRTLHSGNTSEIKLKLTPPALGAVRLHFTEENDEVRAKIYVENAEVKAAIQNNIHRLKESIAANGVEIQRVEVHVQNESKNNHERQSQAHFADGDSTHRDGARDGSHKEENHAGENEDNHKVLSIKNSIAASSNLTIDYIF